MGLANPDERVALAERPSGEAILTAVLFALASGPFLLAFAAARAFPKKDDGGRGGGWGGGAHP
jgi:hypothetical protein